MRIGMPIWNAGFSDKIFKIHIVVIHMVVVTIKITIIFGPTRDVNTKGIASSQALSGQETEERFPEFGVANNY
jgi:hypothetical protein